MKRLRPVVARVALISVGATGIAWWCIRAAEGPPLKIEPQLFPGGVTTSGGTISLEIEGGRKALSEWGLELIQVPDGTVSVVDVVPYLPAARKGVRFGDVLVSVNGKAVKGRSIEYIVMMMDSGPTQGKSIDLSPKNVDLLFSRAGKTYHALLPRGIQTTFARPTTH